MCKLGAKMPFDDTDAYVDLFLHRFEYRNEKSVFENAYMEFVPRLISQMFSIFVHDQIQNQGKSQ